MSSRIKAHGLNGLDKVRKFDPVMIKSHARARRTKESPVVLTGNYNFTPSDKLSLQATPINEKNKRESQNISKHEQATPAQETNFVFSPELQRNHEVHQSAI